MTKKSAPSKAKRPVAVSHTSQGHHLVAWIFIWVMFATALVTSIAFLTRVDWKWLSEYAYEQTHQEELEHQRLLRALDQTTCKMAIAATEASTSTCQALGFIKATATSTTTTTTKSTR